MSASECIAEAEEFLRNHGPASAQGAEPYRHLWALLDGVKRKQGPKPDFAHVIASAQNYLQRGGSNGLIRSLLTVAEESLTIKTETNAATPSVLTWGTIVQPLTRAFADYEVAAAAVALHLTKLMEARGEVEDLIKHGVLCTEVNALRRLVITDLALSTARYEFETSAKKAAAAVRPTIERARHWALQDGLVGVTR